MPVIDSRIVGHTLGKQFTTNSSHSKHGRVSKSPRGVITATFLLITAKIDRFSLITANLHNLIAANCKNRFLPPPSPPPSPPPPPPSPPFPLSPLSLLLSSLPLSMNRRARDGHGEGGVLRTMSNCQSIVTLRLHVCYGCILSSKINLMALLIKR